MPHYYFHVRDGELHEDKIGETLPDADAARAHGRKIANELTLNTVEEVSVNVRDKDDNSL